MASCCGGNSWRMGGAKDVADDGCIVDVLYYHGVAVVVVVVVVAVVVDDVVEMMEFQS